jgi:nitroreductase
MNVLEAILTRRSVRAYRPDPIPDDVWADLLKAMQQAPSASNRQPWKFIVVDRPELKEKLAAACFNQKYIAQAPKVVVVAGNELDAWRGKGGWVNHWEIVDAAIAMDHLQLAAHERGLGTCWIGAYEAAQVEALLGIRDPWHLIVLTPVGFPLEVSPYRGRKPLDEIVSYNTFK